MARKPNARTFGQDLMRGEYVVDTKSNGGVLMPSHTSGDPSFYAKKRAKEAEIGRDLTTEEFLAQHYNASESPTASGTSIFDPVLCELAYRWFCPPTGIVLDPFAGGSVRGIVAAKLGRKYFGVDLSARQIEANRAQAKAIGCEPAPEWIVGDSRHIETLCKGIAADFVFSCPPYFDLERYSDDELDLSNCDWASFRKDYQAMVAAACRLLNPDRFACFVVGDIRDKAGFYRGLPSLTIKAFEGGGARLYNEAVLVTAVGSLPVRAGRQFEATRKLGKTHQNVLIFCKGDPRKATTAIGPVEFGEVPEAEEGTPVVEELAQ